MSEPDLPAPLVPTEVDLRDENPPWDEFIGMLVDTFGLSDDEAAAIVEDVKRLRRSQ